MTNDVSIEEAPNPTELLGMCFVEVVRGLKEAKILNDPRLLDVGAVALPFDRRRA
jgi:hypothetical protein